MAYADGELEDDLRRDVESYLVDNPHSQRRLEAFVQTGRKLRHLFDRPMREPVPLHLVSLIKGTPERRPTDLQFFRRMTPYSKGRPAPPRPSFGSLAIAASVASLFAIGASALIYFEQQHSRTTNSNAVEVAANGGSIASVALAAVLDHARSGSTVTQSIGNDQTSIKPNFTFRTVAGGYCRQYEVSRAQSAQMSGIACRDRYGTWKVAIETPFSERRTTTDAIVPAGRKSSEAIDAVVDQLIAGDVLGLDDEEKAITGGWESNKP